MRADLSAAVRLTRSREAGPHLWSRDRTPRGLPLSPAGCGSYLGLMQWFAVLSRPYFSVLDRVCKHVRDYDDHEPATVPQEALAELTIFNALYPLLDANLARPWLPDFFATDAAPEYGFGTCRASVGADFVRELARLSERRGDYVRLCKPGGPAAEKSRLGRPRRLPLHASSFSISLCRRAKYKAHSGVLELECVLLWLKWLCKTYRRHHSRALVLIDTKAALGAVAKGRSPARHFNRILRGVAALALGSDIRICSLYFPSEDNPADFPPRGKRIPLPRNRVGRDRLRVRTRFQSKQ